MLSKYDPFFKDRNVVGYVRKIRKKAASQHAISHYDSQYSSYKILFEKSSSSSGFTTTGKRRKRHRRHHHESLLVANYYDSVAIPTTEIFSLSGEDEEVDEHLPDYGNLRIDYDDYDDDDTTVELSATADDYYAAIAKEGIAVGRRRMIFEYEWLSKTEFRDLYVTPPDDDNDAYYAFDDDYRRGHEGLFNSNDDGEGDEDTVGNVCRRTSAHRRTQPNCNAIQELSYLDNSIYYIKCVRKTFFSSASKQA